MINIGEILVVNVAGVLILFVLLLFRRRSKETKHISDRLFDAMIWITAVALVMETLSFLLDGKPGMLIRVLQYLINGYLFLGSFAVGMLWVLYVDHHIYHSIKRMRKLLNFVAVPFLLIAVLVVFDLFGAGNLFSITEENVYVRGRLMVISYIILFSDYAASIVLAVVAVKRRGHVQFFPIHYFVLPCVVGTIAQVMNYGLSIGWFCVSLAFMFSQMQLQNLNAFVDDLSGLYNRKYYSYFISKLEKSRNNKTVSGIMLDVNHFKNINDKYGHTTGDDAIRSIGMILSEVTTESNMVFRLAGDEFVIISVGIQEPETVKLIDSIHRQVELFNSSSGKPYKLYLAAGYSICETENLSSDDFLYQMDMKMYEAKAAYYSQKGKDRRK